MWYANKSNIVHTVLSVNRLRGYDDDQREKRIKLLLFSLCDIVNLKYHYEYM